MTVLGPKVGGTAVASRWVTLTWAARVCVAAYEPSVVVFHSSREDVYSSSAHYTNNAGRSRSILLSIIVNIVATWNKNYLKGILTALTIDVKSCFGEVKVRQHNRVNTKDVDFRAFVIKSILMINLKYSRRGWIYLCTSRMFCFRSICQATRTRQTTCIGGSIYCFALSKYSRPLHRSSSCLRLADVPGFLHSVSSRQPIALSNM